jgi:hypothetical protein
MLLKLALWVCFLFGAAIYILMRMSWTVRGSNAVKTRKQYLEVYWDIILIRQSIAAAGFWVLVSYPAVFTKLVALAHVNWNLDLPLIPPLRLFGGLAADVFLDYWVHKIPAVEKRLPNLPRKNGNNGTPPAGADRHRHRPADRPKQIRWRGSRQVVDRALKLAKLGALLAVTLLKASADSLEEVRDAIHQMRNPPKKSRGRRIADFILQYVVSNAIKGAAGR